MPPMPLQLSYNQDSVLSKNVGRGTELKEMIELEIKVDRELKLRQTQLDTMESWYKDSNASRKQSTNLRTQSIYAFRDRIAKSINLEAKNPYLFLGAKIQ